jgi:hemerythrin
MMSLVTWDDSLSVRVPSIDAQHRKLVDLLNHLNDSMMQRKGHQVLGYVLEELVSYTKTHFSHEERLMQAYGYPEYQRHKAEHDHFVRQVSEIKERFQQGQIGLSIEVLNFLKNWLINHILGSDKKYSPLLSAKGAA